MLTEERRFILSWNTFFKKRRPIWNDFIERNFVQWNPDRQINAIICDQYQIVRCHWKCSPKLDYILWESDSPNWHLYLGVILKRRLQQPICNANHLRQYNCATLNLGFNKHIGVVKSISCWSRISDEYIIVNVMVDDIIVVLKYIFYEVNSIYVHGLI